MLQRYVIGTSMLLACFISGVNCHGFLWNPPGRSVAYKAGYKTPANYDHMGLNCGGFYAQWEKHGGKCGVCGDNYGQPVGKRDNEAGGKYALADRTVTGTYIKGQILRVEVNLTAYHKGFFTFRLCANNNFSKVASQECLDKNILTLNGSSSIKYDISQNEQTHYTIDLQLPKDLVCSQCVLQWNYTTGNSWRNWPGHAGCLGCGPQETFINCADIAIVESNEAATTSSHTIFQSSTMSAIMGATSIKPSTSPNSPNTSTVSQSTASASSMSDITVPTSNKDEVNAADSAVNSTKRYLTASKSSEISETIVASSSTTTTASTHLLTDMIVSPSICKCKGVNAFANFPGMEDWCSINCLRGFCPESHCKCNC